MGERRRQAEEIDSRYKDWERDRQRLRPMPPETVWEIEGDRLRRMTEEMQNGRQVYRG